MRDSIDASLATDVVVIGTGAGAAGLCAAQAMWEAATPGG